MWIEVINLENTFFQNGLWVMCNYVNRRADEALSKLYYQKATSLRAEVFQRVMLLLNSICGFSVIAN